MLALRTLKLTVLSMLVCTAFLSAEPVRIMPLGNSITYDQSILDAYDERPAGLRTGYRSHLWYMLQSANYSADFVGGMVAGQDVEPPFDPDNEGHPGWTSYDLAEHVYNFLLNNPADKILLHIGTNDYSSSVDGVETILNYIDLFEQDSGHSIKVYVAMIINRREHDETIAYFNSNLMVMVGRRIRNGDNLRLVDMYRRAGLNAGDYIDDTHPNDTGYNKMAQIWYYALTGPETPGLYAFPYILADRQYINPSSLYVDYNSNTVSFTINIPNEGIRF
jgi:hypothetical protein